jgi:hypothetical protein
MTDKFQKFLADHSISAHTFTAGISTAFLLYTTDPDVRKFVDDIAAGHPKIMKFIGLAVLLYARYAGSKTTSSVTSTVTLTSSPKDDGPPTVEAKTTKTE